MTKMFSVLAKDINMDKRWQKILTISKNNLSHLTSVADESYLGCNLAMGPYYMGFWGLAPRCSWRCSSPHPRCLRVDFGRNDGFGKVPMVPNFPMEHLGLCERTWFLMKSRLSLPKVWQTASTNCWRSEAKSWHLWSLRDTWNSAGSGRKGIKTPCKNAVMHHDGPQVELPFLISNHVISYVFM